MSGFFAVFSCLVRSSERLRQRNIFSKGAHAKKRSSGLGLVSFHIKSTDLVESFAIFQDLGSVGRGSPSILRKVLRCQNILICRKLYI